MFYIRSLVTIALIVSLMSACGGDDGVVTDADGGSLDTSIRDSDANGDAAVGDASQNSDATAADMLGMSDASVADMAGSSDAAAPLDIQSCADACARVSACNRQDLFGDEQGCIRACQQSSRTTPPSAWFDCLEVEECNLLHLCRLPEPRPLTCEETCGAIDDCGVELPVPDCLSECEARNDEGGFATCGEHLFDGLCDGDAFWGCLSSEVYSECGSRCDIGLGCNLVREAECLPDCIRELTSTDPLTRHRGDERNLCLRFIGDDCAAADRCFNPEIEQPVNADRATFCRLWDGCLADFIPCEEIWPIAESEPGIAECIVRILSQGCPADPEAILGQCFQMIGGGGQGAISACGALCESLEICEQFPQDQDRQGCIAGCLDDLQGDDPGAVEHQRRRAACGAAYSCPELRDCISSNESGEACPRHCQAVAACGGQAPDCLERCEDDFQRPRHTAWRDCVAAAGADCPGVLECTPAPVVGCEEVCLRRAECGLDDPDCPERCDDFQFADFDAALAVFACVTSAPLCDGQVPGSVEFCFEEEPLPNGPWTSCLGYCRSQHGCGTGNAEAVFDCVNRCGLGLIGEESYAMEEGRHCAEAAAVCGAAMDCFPERVVDACGDWCDGLISCDAGPEGCGDGCDALSRRRSHEQASCRREAGDECAEVVDCLPEARNGLPDVEGAALFAACRELCVAKGECGGLEESVRSCVGGCYEAATSPAPEIAERQRLELGCGTSGSCVELANCQQVSSPVSACRLHCERVAGCGDGQGDCEAECDSLFFRTRHQSLRACVASAAPYDAEREDWDCAQVTQCTLTEILDCESQCERMAQCGEDDPGCEQRCDNENFAEPALARQRFSCVMSAPRCAPFGPGATGACADEPESSGAACLAECTRVDSCGAGDPQELSRCLATCGRDRSDALDVTAAAAQRCLDGRADACGSFEECSAAPLGVDCANVCQTLDACGDLPRLARIPDDCEADCRAGGAAMLRALQLDGCIEMANGDCQVLAECADLSQGEGEPGREVGQAEVCGRYNACGVQNVIGIPCEQIIALVNPDQEQLRCLFDELSPCPEGGNPEFILDRCIGGEGPPAPDHYEPCGSYCAIHELCDLDDAGARDCWGDCYSALARNPFHPYAGRLGCRFEFSCGALAVCLDPPDAPRPCSAVCQEATDCGAFGDAEACEALCNANRFSPLASPTYVDEVQGCLGDLMDAQCANQGRACFDVREPEEGTCEEACLVMARCQEEGDLNQCIQGCLDAQEEDPEMNQMIVDCVLASLEPPQRCDFGAIDACVQAAMGNRLPGGGPGGPPPPPP